jgi:hypothetical protein
VHRVWAIADWDSHAAMRPLRMGPAPPWTVGFAVRREDASGPRSGRWPPGRESSRHPHHVGSLPETAETALKGCDERGVAAKQAKELVLTTAMAAPSHGTEHDACRAPAPARRASMITSTVVDPMRSMLTTLNSSSRTNIAVGSTDVRSEAR